MARTPAKPISLALQGGGAHGAFTWGVLDAILDDGRLDPRAITATSAGAMNAVAFAQGRYEGGIEGARAALERFWKAVSRAGAPFRPLIRPTQGFTWFPWLDALARLTSPYDVNPYDINPLREILSDQIDFDAVHACRETQLFITATGVEDGRARVFQGREVTRDAVLASACLPFLSQAVKIDQRPYWDGGFTGNPTLWPLFYADTPADLVIVHINPLERPGTPKTPEDIMNRVHEITFNASLLAELRAIAFVKDLIRNDLLKDPKKARLRDMLVHSIKADDEMRDYPAASKYNTEWHFLIELRDLGRKAAFNWLNNCADQIGQTSTIDLNTDFLMAEAAE
ncbi:patatin-like phospholipase family protein [Woodsholea maritima]|uniref:patatin-like phospholipase family protein n=1 Tax=Woodsholea maritima TaxID=240237 RepID=UPI00035EE343|nr:patatin-like phospholipase family protein [Woodsholea maritima]